MSRFFISDTHFGHKNIIDYSQRPFLSVEEMNNVIVDNWNHVVSPEDTVYHLGDVAMGPWTAWDSVLTRLNGYKVLVVGNHDRVFKGFGEKQNEKFAPYYHGWFDEVHDNLRGLWLDDGSIVDLSHFPYDGDSHDGDRYKEARLHDGGRTLIHGHTHAEYKKDGDSARVSRSRRGSLQIHVGVDAWNFRPVSEDEVIALIEAS